MQNKRSIFHSPGRDLEDASFLLAAPAWSELLLGSCLVLAWFLLDSCLAPCLVYRWHSVAFPFLQKRSHEPFLIFSLLRRLQRSSIGRISCSVRGTFSQPVIFQWEDHVYSGRFLFRFIFFIPRNANRNPCRRRRCRHRCRFCHRKPVPRLAGWSPAFP